MTGKAKRKTKRAPSQHAPRHSEPVTFAWTEPLVELPPLESEVISVPKQVVLVGHRPGAIERITEYGNRLSAAMPSPMAAAAGVAVLLSSLVGVALIAPGGEQATAARPLAAQAKTPVADAKAQIAPMTERELSSLGANSRDPFATEGFKPLPVKKKQTAREKKAAQKAGKNKAKKKQSPVSRRTPSSTSATTSRMAAEFIFYSSDMPWSTFQRKQGTWINIGGKPTLKFISVDSSGANVYVVSDFEVLEGQGKRKARYEYPTRMLRISNGSVVRFADYRDSSGEDITYTLRYRKSVTR